MSTHLPVNRHWYCVQWWCTVKNVFFSFEIESMLDWSDFEKIINRKKNYPNLNSFFELCTFGTISVTLFQYSTFMFPHDINSKKKKETLSCFLIFLLFCLSGFPPFYISYFFLLSLKLRGFRRCLLDRRRSFSRICEFVRGETCVSHKSWHLPDFILCVSECMWAWSCLRYHFVFGYFSRFQ